MLFRADEMQAAGMSAGDITAMAFRVFSPNGAALLDFEIRAGLTNDTVLSSSWTTGLSAVWGPNDYTDQAGWNLHTFTSPIFWDGVSNFVIQTCNNNQFNSANPIIVQTNTAFSSTIWRVTDTGNICGGPGSGPPQFQANTRPIVEFTFTPTVAPPIANFSPQNVTSCSNTIQFQDLSAFVPDSWLWLFGDGTTDTVQNPLHTYLSDGTYDVTLIASNTFGTDTLTIAGAITVSGSSPQPVSACIPATSSSLGGFGVIEFSYANSIIPSSDGQAENYADRACFLDTVLVGSAMSVAVATAAAAPHNVRVWIDWDNSGTFSNSELIISDNNIFSSSASITVPTTAVLNVPLRVRVIADYQLSPFPTPCGNPQYGQAEDYGLVVEANTQAPIAGFSADPATTCTGQVQFTDLSLNGPTVWQWDFGDGSTSNDPSPLHTYMNDGTYTVTLITINSFGTDTTMQVDLITVNTSGVLTNALCTPGTQSILGDYGIYNVTYGTINNTSNGAIDGYQDYSCEYSNTVLEGTSVPISIATGIQNQHDVFIWLDLDNNGTFTSNELIWSALGEISPSGSISVPFGAIYNTPLRLRVAADAQGALSNACTPPSFGQVEDYALIVQQNTSPPTAFFSSDKTQICLGDSIMFLDQSQNLPTGWTWDFGDGGSSADQNPFHTYGSVGTFNVTLTASNPNGSDAITQTNYVTVVDSLFCDTLTLAFGGQTTSNCYGVVTDNGGANGPYSFFGQGVFSITPAGADIVILSFSQFALRMQDELIVFDGPDNLSPIIGTYTGNTLPNGGTIISSGPAITFELAVAGGPGGGNFPSGFVANWECSFNGIEEENTDKILLYPNPVSDALYVALQEETEELRSIVIYNNTGQIVIENPINGRARVTNVDVGSLPSGGYTVQIISDKRIMTRKIVVN
jgi:PKD repeat protein